MPTAVIPIIAAELGAGAAVASARSASKNAKASQKLQAQGLQTLRDQQAKLNPLGDRLTSLGTDALSPAIRRFSTLAGGSSAAVNDEMAPELNARNAQDRAATSAAAETAPRGTIPNLATRAFTRIGQEVNTRAGVRSDAANRLGAIGSSLVGNGLNAYNAASGDATAGINAGRASQQDQYGMYADSGQAIYDIIRQFRKGGSGGSTWNPDPTTAGVTNGSPSGIFGIG